MPTRAVDFRYIFANAFGMQIGQNEMTIKFGFTEDVSKPTESILEHVGVIVTLQSAKMLGLAISEAIGSFEKSNNITIPLPDTKLEEIHKIIKDGVKGGPKPPSA